MVKKKNEEYDKLQEAKSRIIQKFGSGVVETEDRFDLTSISFKDLGITDTYEKQAIIDLRKGHIKAKQKNLYPFLKKPNIVNLKKEALGNVGNMRINSDGFLQQWNNWTNDKVLSPSEIQSLFNSTSLSDAEKQYLLKKAINEGVQVEWGGTQGSRRLSSLLMGGEHKTSTGGIDYESLDRYSKEIGFTEKRSTHAQTSA